jgi:hypothetical protein
MRVSNIIDSNTSSICPELNGNILSGTVCFVVIVSSTLYARSLDTVFLTLFFFLFEDNTGTVKTVFMSRTMIFLGGYLNTYFYACDIRFNNNRKKM